MTSRNKNKNLDELLLVKEMQLIKDCHILDLYVNTPLQEAIEIMKKRIEGEEREHKKLQDNNNAVLQMLISKL